MNTDQIEFSPFENQLEEDQKHLIEYGFTQEIFDTLVCNIDRQIERIQEETKIIKKFLGEISKDPKEALKEFKKHESIYNILSHDILSSHHRRLIEQFKIPYNYDIQKAINEHTKEYGTNDTENFIKYFKAYGKWEYMLNTAGKKLIELGIAEKWEIGENWHMVQEEGKNKNTIIITSKENHISIIDLPKTPYYRKKVQIPKNITNKTMEEEQCGPF